MTIISPLPFTLANGTTADADKVMADLNQIRNDVNVQVPIAIAAGASVPSFKGAIIYSSVNQTIAPLTTTALTFNTVLINTAATINLGAQPTRITIPTGYAYARIRGQVRINVSPADREVQLAVYKNGTATEVPPSAAYVPGAHNLQVVSRIYSVTAGDYFELRLIHAGSGSADTQAVDGVYFDIELFT